MAKQFVNPSEGLHPPIGNGYTHAVRAGNHVYIAGQVALDESGNIVGKDDPAVQADQVFKNVVTALQGAGATVDDVVRITAFITRREDIGAIRDARAKYFPMVNPPAAALILVAGLIHPDLLMEVEADAVID